MQNLFVLLLLLIAGCSKHKEFDAAMQQPCFEHYTFLSKHRLYLVEPVGFFPIDVERNPKLHTVIFQEKVCGFEYKIATITSARRLALLVIDDSLQRFNSQQKFKNLVRNFPLGDQDLDILIQFHALQGPPREGFSLQDYLANSTPVASPYISLVSIDGGKIGYYSWNTEGEYSKIFEEEIVDAYKQKIE